jgi:hypothetical protein
MLNRLPSLFGWVVRIAVCGVVGGALASVDWSNLGPRFTQGAMMGVMVGMALALTATKFGQRLLNRPFLFKDRSVNIQRQSDLARERETFLADARQQANLIREARTGDTHGR